MELLLVRHGIAADARPGQPDSTRSLTLRGRRRLQRAVAGLVALDLHCDGLLHSPWRRAAQTAGLLAPLVRGPSLASALLAAPPGPELLAAVRAAGDRGASPERAGSEPRIALVGHQPWMGELVGLLAGGPAGGPVLGDGVLFGKGGVAWLVGACQPGGMQLRALLPPRVLRQLGRS